MSNGQLYLFENEASDVVDEIAVELDQAEKLYPPFASAHEGYAILLEEVEELWDEIKVKQANHNYDNMRKEAVQIAAMAARFIKDICDKGKSK